VLRICRLAVVLLLAAGLLTTCRRTETPLGETAVPEPRIGVILPLTGNAAVYGVALRNGIELARGQDPHPLQLVYDDDRGQSLDSVAATQKMINVAHVPVIIGGAMSSTAEPIIPICTRSSVVLLSPTATKPSLTRMGNFFFRLWPSDDYDGKIMADAAYSKLAIRRVGILFVNVAYGVGITDVFEREFTRRGGVVVAREGYSQGATDFRATLSKIADTKPDAVFIPGYVVEVTQILKQAKELGIRTRFLGGNSLYDPKLIEIAGTAAEGALFSYPTFDAASSDPAIAKFVAAYRTKHGSDPDTFAAQGYDAYRVLRQALASGARTGPDIASALRQVKSYEGPGGNVSFDQYGDVEKRLRLLTIRDGKFVPAPSG